jgi:hypothetical protein
MVSSTAYYIKFDGFSPTFFNQFLVVVVIEESYMLMCFAVVFKYGTGLTIIAL